MPRSAAEISASAAEDLDRVLATVAASLEAELDSLTARVAEEIHAEMPELGEHARITARTLGAVRANLGGFLTFMRAGVPADEVDVSGSTADYARAFVHRGIGLPAAIRCFRLGHELMWRAWAEAIDRTGPEPEMRAALTEVVSASMFQFVDRTTIAIVEVYQLERERWNRSADARRAEIVGAILDGETVDLEAANRSLNYNVQAWHVALVLWADDEDAGAMQLERTASELSLALTGSDRPLMLTSGGTALWAWAGGLERPDDEAIDKVLKTFRSEEVSVALGEPGHGVDGFRESHTTALHTRRVMRLMDKRPGTVRRFGALNLMSLLTADAGQMSSFIADELGELAADDDATSRLRATLVVYFDERSSAVKTGRRLGIHTNTVNYRIRRCAELIGHPVHERRREIDVALMLRQAIASTA